MTEKRGKLAVRKRLAIIRREFVGDGSRFWCSGRRLVALAFEMLSNGACRLNGLRDIEAAVAYARSRPARAG